MKKLALPLVLLIALAPAVGARADDAVVIGNDAVGDWGTNVDPTLGPAGDALGMDLKYAAIDTSTQGVAKFIFGLTSLPSNGGVPESPRYIWEMKVNGKHVELDGKFTNYSRGTCDPTANTCPPPRDPGAAPFSVKGNCTDNGTTVYTCTEIGLIHAFFDVTNARIEVAVPLSMLGVQGCATIIPDVNTASFDASGNLITIPSAFVSQSSLPLDYLTLDDEVEVTAC